MLHYFWTETVRSFPPQKYKPCESIRLPPNGNTQETIFQVRYQQDWSTFYKHHSSITNGGIKLPYCPLCLCSYRLSSVWRHHPPALESPINWITPLILWSQHKEDTTVSMYTHNKLHMNKTCSSLLSLLYRGHHAVTRHLAAIHTPKKLAAAQQKKAQNNGPLARGQWGLLDIFISNCIRLKNKHVLLRDHGYFR